MNIIKTSRDMNSVELYRMTKNPSILKMRDIVGATLSVTDWCHYTDTNQKGEEHEILSLRDAGGETYATNSATFIRSFFEILDILAGAGEKLDTIVVIQGTSKAGRTYITCAL